MDGCACGIEYPCARGIEYPCPRLKVVGKEEGGGVRIALLFLCSPCTCARFIKKVNVECSPCTCARYIKRVNVETAAAFPGIRELCVEIGTSDTKQGCLSNASGGYVAAAVAVSFVQCPAPPRLLQLQPQSCPPRQCTCQCCSLCHRH
jgi:hypothetical protein